MSTIERAAAKLSKSKGTAKIDSSTGDSVSDFANDTGTDSSTPVPGQDAVVLDTQLERAEALIEPVSGLADPLPHRVAAVDLEYLDNLGYATPLNSKNGISQEFRRIKRPLLLNIAKQRTHDPEFPLNLIMVTSSLPSEGKTFVATNLALSIAAEVDRTALLVDADIARGDVADVLGLEAEYGLVDLLDRGSLSVNDYVIETNVDHLYVLPAGQPHPRLDELIASEWTRDFLVGLANEDPDRIVVVDAPPLIATTEASVLAGMMGQIVFVVEADRTPERAVAEALELLDGCHNVSAVLNKSSAQSHFGYGYGYGSRYPAHKGSGGADVRQS